MGEQYYEYPLFGPKLFCYRLRVACILFGQMTIT